MVYRIEFLYDSANNIFLTKKAGVDFLIMKISPAFRFLQYFLNKTLFFDKILPLFYRFSADCAMLTNSKKVNFVVLGKIIKKFIDKSD